MIGKVYWGLIKFVDKFVPKKFRPLWEHPAGPQTIHFWAPLFKWGLVMAGIGDIQRPAELLSVPQSGSLAVTGLLWARYSMTIIPVNYNLCSVNLFVAVVGAYQLSRALKYQQEKKEAEKKQAARK